MRERREAEEARKALELAEVRKDDFIAMLSHELRNPIAPIDSAIKAALAWCRTMTTSRTC